MVCHNNQVEEKGREGDSNYYNCPNCGKYNFYGIRKAQYQTMLDADERKRAVLSHAIWKMQKPEDQYYFPKVDAIDEILKGNYLPDLDQ